MERSVSDEQIAIRVNGQDRTVSAGMTVRGLLEFFELRPELVVVERNRVILTRDRYDAEPIEAGDTLELVHFVGGG